MAQPLTSKNKCLEHNLLKRSLGLPYKFSWREDEFVQPHQQTLSGLLDQETNVVPCYGVPGTWNINLVRHSGFTRRSREHLSEPKQSSLNTALHIDANDEGAVDDAKEYDTKELVTNEQNTRLCNVHFNCKSTKPVKPVYRPCFPKMVKNQVLKPKCLDCPLTIDKIFCCEWISDDEVIFGTKCQRLLRYNTTLDCFATIMEPALSRGTPCSSGIRCMKRNLSSTLLATADSSSHKVVLYLLPSMVPVLSVADNLDNNRIFDLCWLSDSKLAVAKREGTVTIWNFQSLFVRQSLEESLPSVSLCMNSTAQSDNTLLESTYHEPKVLTSHDESSFEVSPENYCEISLHVADRVRAIAFNGDQTLFLLNSGGFVCSFNTVTYKCNWSMPVPGGLDNTCLAYSESLKLLAVGSSVCIMFLEDCGDCPRLSEVDLPTSDSLYVRSLAFYGQSLSIGTGTGQLLFIDLSQFWSGKLSYYRTRYLFPVSKHNETHKFYGYLDPRRDIFDYSQSLKNANIDSMFDNSLSHELSRVQTFDKPLLKTFYEVAQSFQKSSDSKNIKRKIEKYYTDLDKQCEDDIESKYVEEYCRRELTNFEAKTLMSAQQDRASLLPDDSLAVYAQSYNANTGQLFVGGGPISLMREGAFCALLR